MSTHFSRYPVDEGPEQAPCGVWIGDASDLSSDWSRVDCKRCLKWKDTIMATHEAEESAIVQQMGDMADFMKRTAGDEMTDIPRFNAPRGTTLCEAVGGELVMAADHDAEVGRLRAALHSCAKVSSAAEVGLIADEALVATTAPEVQRCPKCESDTAIETRRLDGIEAVALQRILFEHHRDARPADVGLMGWAAAVLAKKTEQQAPVAECELGYGHGGKWCGPHVDCWLDPRSRQERQAQQALAPENQRVVPVEPLLAKPHPFDLLAADHKGMRVDYSGLLKQAVSALRRGVKEPGLAEMLRQLQEHMTELGQRWYHGDTAVVDELLQLYAVEDGARDALKKTQGGDK